MKRHEVTHTWVLIAVVIAIAAACGSSPGVPPADGPTDVVPLPPARPAVMALPVTISLAAVSSRLDLVFPLSDSLDRARCTALGGAVCHQYVYRREPFRMAMTDDRLSIVAALRYRGRVALPLMGGVGSCGYAPQAMRRAELRFSTSLYWRSDWRLGTRGTSLAAELSDRCDVTVLDLDVTPLMRRIADAQLLDMQRELDSIIPALVDLRPAADSLWRLLQRPMALDSVGSLWLELEPDAVGLASVTGVGGTVRTAVVLTARPRVLLGGRPGGSIRPLPSLTVAPNNSGLRVPVDVILPFDDLGRRATELLYAENAGKDIRVREVRVRGSGDTVLVRVELEGRVDGTLHMAGRMRYDAAERALRLDDLHYTVESTHFMTRLRVTLGAPLVRRAIDRATSHGRLDVGAQLDTVRLQLNSQLNRQLAPGVSVGGGITDVRVVGLHATPNAFVVRVELVGTAQIFVQ